MATLIGNDTTSTQKQAFFPARHMFSLLSGSCFLEKHFEFHSCVAIGRRRSQANELCVAAAAANAATSGCVVYERERTFHPYLHGVGGTKKIFCGSRCIIRTYALKAPEKGEE
jgi:hypothetical protein